jgi:asparagine synthase (glutamine-hydrolysing)
MFSHRPRWRTTSKTKLFFSDELKESLNGMSPEDTLKSTLPPELSGWSALGKAQYIESRNLLAGYILSSQGDRISMGNSVEGRYPFLDHRVVEFCAKLPPHYKIRGLNEKYVLKKTMEEYLPQRIVRRTKQPYRAPDSECFFINGKAPDYVEELLSGRCLNDYGYFNSKAVALLIKKCRRNRAIGFRDNMALVGILSTQLLHNLFIETFEV